MNMKKLKQEIENRGGLLTGSRAWGLETAESDWDFIIPEKKIKNITWYLKKRLGSSDSDWDFSVPDHYYLYCSQTYRFHTIESQINLICVSNPQLKAWLFATRSLSAFAEPDA